MGLVVSSLRWVVEDAPTAIAMLVALCNAILLGWGVWWDAPALYTFGIINLVACALVVVNHRCVRLLGGIITTILYAAPIVTGYIGVQAYSCLRSCDASPGQFGISVCANVQETCGIDPNTFLFSSSWGHWAIPFSIEIEQFINSLINSVPEGCFWATLALAAVGGAASILWWDLSNLFSFLNAGGGGINASIEPKMPLLTLPSVQTEREGKKAETV